MLIANFTFGDALLTVLEIFFFVVYFWILITIFADLSAITRCRGGERPAGSSCFSSRPSSGC